MLLLLLLLLVVLFFDVAIFFCCSGVFSSFPHSVPSLIIFFLLLRLRFSSVRCCSTFFVCVGTFMIVIYYIYCKDKIESLQIYFLADAGAFNSA